MHFWFFKDLKTFLFSVVLRDICILLNHFSIFLLHNICKTVNHFPLFQFATYAKHFWSLLLVSDFGKLACWNKLRLVFQTFVLLTMFWSAMEFLFARYISLLKFPFFNTLNPACQPVNISVLLPWTNFLFYLFIIIIDPLLCPTQLFFCYFLKPDSRLVYAFPT